MSATEYNFPQPPQPYPYSWLDICQNVWGDFVGRWNTTQCNGGLKWQIFPQNKGYDYKNAIANGGFFQLSARLARYTGNSTYIDWANKIWDWSADIGLIDNLYNVYDGTDDTINCTQLDHAQWSYNLASYLYGAAVLQNYTNGSSVWVNRTAGLLEATATFFSPYENSTNIMFEAECERGMTCNVDQFSMKAYLARWLAGTSKLAPFTQGAIGPLLQTSAAGASSSCSGGPNNQTCGAKWYIGGWDGTSGLGQQLSALEVMYSLLVNSTQPPGVQGNVHIRSEPVATTIAPPAPSASIRPLFDSPKNAAAYIKIQAACLCVSALCVVFSLLL